ncbi:hypothetical protein [Staphylococcus phage Stab22]|nr:hypothetical protein vBSauClo6_123 [Staphylococcus phage vB_Sau_Clo6]ARM69478.1 hypothetical protein vBSauS24_123 [Staphylococcus phage vB_Sau_S24]VEV89526.1 hypothetical protein [Staphylococcus phage Stab22]
MYRFLLFSYAEYYPSGGLDDLILQFNTIEELKEVDTFDISDYVEVYDFKAGEEIFGDHSPDSREHKVAKLVSQMEEYLKNNAWDLKSPKPGVRNEKTLEEMMEDSHNKFGELYKGLAEIERKEKEDDLK